MSLKLSVIIVNYNVRYFLEQTLLSVRRASEGVDLDVWVVDNNSPDDSVAMVRDKFPEVKLTANTGNPGFSVANNQAIRASTGEYVLLLNPDTVIAEDTLRKCIDFMDAHPQAGGLGVKMIDGSGAFLPESKRGFPSPWVAFAKTTGLSRLFSKSPRFNHYHLGYLEPDETHRIEVLSGAFMWMRRSALDEVGLLDETFFMYGEDIDLSYRLVQGGYHNYYFADTTIIHYKGESTKKGSLNYVRMFYLAMIIFARKHFGGTRQGKLFVWVLQAGVYLRAGMTVGSNLLRWLRLPLLDGALIVGGLILLKDIWPRYYYGAEDYFSDTFLWFNLPLYTVLWLAALYFSGAYDPGTGLRRPVTGVLLGMVVIAAVYGFLPLAYRSSRALILLATLWSLLTTVGVRMALHFFRTRNLAVGSTPVRRILIVGTAVESRRVQWMLYQLGVRARVIGTVAPDATDDLDTYLGVAADLERLVALYQIDELLFCAQDLSHRRIISWMDRLGPGYLYKIVPDKSESIIGSHSKNTSGQLYTVEVHYRLGEYAKRRNKRVLDIVCALVLLLSWPITGWLTTLGVRQPVAALQVLLGYRTWVGYATEHTAAQLPRLRPGVYDTVPLADVDRATRARLDFFYARDYRTSLDLHLLWQQLSR